MKLTLKVKYVGLSAGLLAVIVGFFVYMDLKTVEKKIIIDNSAKVSLITKIIKNSLMTMMLEGKGTEFKGFVRTLYSNEIKTLRLFSPDGRIISSSVPSEEIKGLKQPSWKISQPQMTSYEENGHLIYLMHTPIYNEMPCQRCHGKKQELMAILSVEVIMDSVNERIGGVREKSTLSFFGIVVLAGVSLWLLMTFLITRPLRDIVRKAKMLEDGNFNIRFSTGRKDEIGELSEELNSMLNELNRVRGEVEKCHLESMQRVEKMATIGELASAIAHEIKNPLAGISGAIQVFAEDFSESEPRRSIINEVLTEIERLDKAVKDLLNFARPPEPILIKTHLIHVIERAIRLVSSQAKKQNVNIIVKVAEDIPEIYIDPEQMHQVFLNIMLNALHSMLSGGVITITTHLYPDNNAEITITDTGVGIPQENIKNVFKPFFTTKHTGTGLGLAISKNIVQKHGGDIEVESQLGVGSIFRIKLPLEHKNA